MSSNPNYAVADRTVVRDRRRVVLSSYLGTTIEFYDFLLYATASAVVFGPVFFSGLDPWAGVIASYGTFAAGYVARPLGGVIFGHFGDRLGRKKLLVISMVIMGTASTAIGLVPGPDLIGAWGAVILVLLRVIQGIAIGGEWGGAALMALEHADPKSRGFAASFTNAGAPTGSVLGLLVMSAFSTLPQEDFLAWGWRVPFLLSFVLLLVGLYVRSRVSESPVFQDAMARLDSETPQNTHNKGARRTIPLLQVLRRPGLLVTIILAATSAFALQTLLSTFAISYTVSLGVPRSEVMLAFAGAGIISIGTTLLMGRISDRLGRKPLMIAGNILFILVLVPVFALLSTGNLALVFLAFTLGIVTQTVLYGPMAAFIAERFGTGSRYTGASLGYQVATLLGAGFTPIVLANLYGGSGQSITPVIIYLAAIALLSLVTVVFMPESKDRSLTDEEGAPANMPEGTAKVTFHHSGGSIDVLDIEPGTSVMRAAVTHGIPGIVGECGGQAMCATCHVYVREQHRETLPPVGEDEDEMLDCTTADRLGGSRLGCQLIAGSGWESLEVDLPGSQT